MTWTKGNNGAIQRGDDDKEQRHWMCAKRAEVHAIYNLLSVSSVWRGNCVGLSSLHDRAVGGAGCAGCDGELVGWLAGHIIVG